MSVTHVVGVDNSTTVADTGQLFLLPCYVDDDDDDDEVKLFEFNFIK